MKPAWYFTTAGFSFLNGHYVYAEGCTFRHKTDTAWLFDLLFTPAEKDSMLDGVGDNQHNDEATLLAVAKAYQDASGFVKRLPDKFSN